jgi:hypothetical protein
VSHITRRSVILVATTALACLALIAPSAASAKKVTIVAKTHLVAGDDAGGGKLEGTATGTFGKCKVTGTAVPPSSTIRLHLKRGTVIATVKNGHLEGGKVVGTFKLKGTGKYKNLKGGGKFSSDLTASKFTYKGNASW